MNRILPQVPERLRTHVTQVMLVEDNPADAVLVKRALRDSGSPPDLKVATDGIEAMRYLRRQDPYPDAKTPDIILLDLNLPGKPGLEVLAEIKADPILKLIPVIVLTSSGRAEDITSSYALGANSYIRKGANLESTWDCFRTIEHFWMNLATLPTRMEGAY